MPKWMKPWLLLAVSLAAFTGGCKVSTAGMRFEKGMSYADDPDFADGFAIVQVSSEKTPGGFLHAQAILKNLRSTDNQCQYCFEWIGENGITLTHAPTSWRPKAFYGGAVQRIDGICPVPGAVDFRVKLRP
jgi:uncharacterized protein YcfL